MITQPKWSLTSDEKQTLMKALTRELSVLRTKADISQEELANLIGVSRQTYGAIERGSRKMTWSTYLSLVLFYDYNQSTHQLIRSLSIFPQNLVKKFNDSANMQIIEMAAFLGEDSQKIVSSLDAQALHSIRTMIMIEYARCTAMPSDAVVKSFDGVTFNPPMPSENEFNAVKALKTLKERQDNE
jgi:Predicted transcriptional regulators